MKKNEANKLIFNPTQYCNRCKKNKLVIQAADLCSCNACGTVFASNIQEAFKAYRSLLAQNQEEPTTPALTSSKKRVVSRSEREKQQNQVFCDSVHQFMYALGLKVKRHGKPYWEL